MFKDFFLLCLPYQSPFWSCDGLILSMNKDLSLWSVFPTNSHRAQIVDLFETSTNTQKISSYSVFHIKPHCVHVMDTF